MKIIKWFFKDIWMVWSLVWTLAIWGVPFWQSMVFGLGIVISLAVKKIIEEK